MRKFLMLGTAALTIVSWEAKAQTDLSAYADANGFLDVQRLSCAQLAGTWQGDADMLMAWYSGWYNGLAKSIFITAHAPGSSSTKSSFIARQTLASGSSMPWR